MEPINTSDLSIRTSNQDSVCYTARISYLSPIEGADKIELATINGWNCIVPKGMYQSGDLCIIAVTDAVIPEKLAEKLNISNYLRNGNRVRTIKLKGVYSECLLMPTSLLSNKTFNEGYDCMSELGISKYEPPTETRTLPSGRKVKYKDNSYFEVYYKFPNIKNVPNIFDENDHVEITRKIHGTSARYGFVKKQNPTILDLIKIKLNALFGWGGNKWRLSDYEYLIGSHHVIKDIYF